MLKSLSGDFYGVGVGVYAEKLSAGRTVVEYGGGVAGVAEGTIDISAAGLYCQRPECF